jgi:hypothetical protein
MKKKEIHILRLQRLTEQFQNKLINQNHYLKTYLRNKKKNSSIHLVDFFYFFKIKKEVNIKITQYFIRILRKRKNSYFFYSIPFPLVFFFSPSH